MNTIFELIPDSSTGTNQGDAMLAIEAMFDKSSNSDERLNLTIRELVQNSLDPIDNNPNVETTKVKIV